MAVCSTEACVPDLSYDLLEHVDGRCYHCLGPLQGLVSEGCAQIVCSVCLAAAVDVGCDGVQSLAKPRTNSRKRLNPAVGDALLVGPAPPLAAGVGLWAEGDDSSVAAKAIGWPDHVPQGSLEGGRAPQRQRSSSLATDDPLEAPAAVSVVPDESSNAAQQRSGYQSLSAEERGFQEVPVLTELGATAATGASALASSGAVPTRSWDQPYSALFSGPGFSYGADENGVFETDGISLGGAEGSGFMIEETDGEEDEDGPLRKSSAIWSAGTAGSGSGGRAGDVLGAALVLSARDVDASAEAAVPNDAVDAGGMVVCSRTGETSVAADALGFALAGNGGDTGPGLAAAVDETDAVALLPPRYGSHESVGSAGAGWDIGGESGAGAPVYAADAGAAADGHWALAGAAAGLPAQDGAAAATGVAMEQAPPAAAAYAADAVGADELSDAAAPFVAPALPAAAPSLLPPEVYLSFVSQLVASVRTATQATANYYQAYHLGGEDGPAAEAAAP